MYHNNNDNEITKTFTTIKHKINCANEQQNSANTNNDVYDFISNNHHSSSLINHQTSNQSSSSSSSILAPKPKLHSISAITVNVNEKINTNLSSLKKKKFFKLRHNNNYDDHNETRQKENLFKKNLNNNNNNDKTTIINIDDDSNDASLNCKNKLTSDNNQSNNDVNDSLLNKTEFNTNAETITKDNLSEQQQLSDNSIKTLPSISIIQQKTTTTILKNHLLKKAAPVTVKRGRGRPRKYRTTTTDSTTDEIIIDSSDNSSMGDSIDKCLNNDVVDKNKTNSINKNNDSNVNQQRMSLSSLNNKSKQRQRKQKICLKKSPPPSPKPDDDKKKILTGKQCDNSDDSDLDSDLDSDSDSDLDSDDDDDDDIGHNNKEECSTKKDNKQSTTISIVKNKCKNQGQSLLAKKKSIKKNKNRLQQDDDGLKNNNKKIKNNNGAETTIIKRIKKNKQHQICSTVEESTTVNIDHDYHTVDDIIEFVVEKYCDNNNHEPNNKKSKNVKKCKKNGISNDNVDDVLNNMIDQITEFDNKVKTTTTNNSSKHSSIKNTMPLRKRKEQQAIRQLNEQLNINGFNGQQQQQQSDSRRINGPFVRITIDESYLEKFDNDDNCDINDDDDDEQIYCKYNYQLINKIDDNSNSVNHQVSSSSLAQSRSMRLRKMKQNLIDAGTEYNVGNWCCILCKQGPNTKFMGELYGPYYLNDNIENEEIWFHEDCFIWSNMPNASPYQPINQLTINFLDECSKLECFFCMKPCPTIACSILRCDRHYHANIINGHRNENYTTIIPPMLLHYPCAKELDYQFDDKNFTITCPDHYCDGLLNHYNNGND